MIMINIIINFAIVSFLFYLFLHFGYYCLAHTDKNNIQYTMHFYKYAIISYICFWICQFNKSDDFKKSLKEKIKYYLPDFIGYF